MEQAEEVLCPGRVDDVKGNGLQTFHNTTHCHVDDPKTETVTLPRSGADVGLLARVQ